ncbi:hypothetical protein WJ96_06715 [Burkholderia ubonensis]|uniref:Uncharacterized protein n=1 Tax=Burkholderia ubonensis TaxID=101571 RepID=A0AAW3MZ00_9BURK|nr:hypothetical protein [Burkholderia ubonensis]KVP75408.1 hypothetical protein WJ93_08515 [Burkholderia ubonensis]KVP96872.1 hypothetical protein WJ97_13630 [Burkholderia ubonensis]KVP98220.1 hypothetical protein WJ96_06715 [Burkholderia ubonensis]KVZ92917.1 hypothetical protein WL25_18375 [Burkholderia ubonensis]
MSHATMPVTVQWPHLAFAPINLWSFPAAWKRDPTEFRPTPEQVTQASTAHQVNPLIRRILSHR